MSLIMMELLGGPVVVCQTRIEMWGRGGGVEVEPTRARKKSSPVRLVNTDTQESVRWALSGPSKDDKLSMCKAYKDFGLKGFLVQFLSGVASRLSEILKVSVALYICYSHII